MRIPLRSWGRGDPTLTRDGLPRRRCRSRRGPRAPVGRGRRVVAHVTSEDQQGKVVPNVKTVHYLVEARTVTEADMNVAAEALLAHRDIGPFEIARGFVVDLTAAVRASRQAMAILAEPTAKAGSKRAAIKSAILFARVAAR